MNARRFAVIAVLATTALAVAHAAAVAPYYRVGSFDDDASYILVARALAHGAGLGTILGPGVALVATYPPGFSALLAPIALVTHELWPYRLLALASLVALFPLTWIYLARRRVTAWPRAGILTLLALSPVLATYSTMVMAELPFLVVLVVLLLVADEWEHDPGVFTRAGLATVVFAGALVWLKEAAVGALAGLVLWLLLRRMWRKALALSGGVALLVSPVVIARLAIGSAIVGSRYANEFSGKALPPGAPSGLRALPTHARMLWFTAIPQTIMPKGVTPLPSAGVMESVIGFGTAFVAPLIVIGFVVWCRDHRDAACLIVPLYFAETIVYPYVNERRVILVLPLVAAWFVLGAVAVGKLVQDRLRHRLPHRLPHRRTVGIIGAVVAVAVVAAPLAWQFRRDYLYPEGQHSSAPDGSSYMALLSRLGTPADVVETDYVWTTALFSGHRTAITASSVSCDGPSVSGALRTDDAAYALSAGLNAVHGVDNDCLLGVLSALAQAVRLYRTAEDDASVFELIGPGSPHPGLVDLLPVAATGASRALEIPQSPSDIAGTYFDVDGTATWTWTTPAQVEQVSVGDVSAPATIALETSDGTWHAVGTVATGAPWVRNGRFAAVVAIRVSLSGTPVAALHDFHVLGTRP